mgnify:CR=1 FL=1
MEYNYDQFIGHYKNALDVKKCRVLINYFDEMHEIKQTYSRSSSDGAPKWVMHDYALEVAKPKILEKIHPNPSISLSRTDPCAQIVREELSRCVGHYVETYDVLIDSLLMPLYHKLQMTPPGGGFHQWHHEQYSEETMNRVLAYTIFLNDVNSGGETEFLYQGKRYPARQGDVMVFPASFTHVHRGNPPLNQVKYILTGWIEQVDTRSINNENDVPKMTYKASMRDN